MGESMTMSREEWLDFRRSHIGGSDVAAILGISPWRTPYQVWAEKVGIAEPEDISDRPRVEWGTRLEREIAWKFRDVHGKRDGLWVVRPSGYQVKVDGDRPWAMATLDGVVVSSRQEDGDVPPAVFEAKTAHFPGSKDWGEDGSGAAGVPPHYLAQVYHYLAVTGWDRAFVAVLIDGWDYREYAIDRDEADVATVTGAVDEFWHGHVETGIAPEVSGAADSRAVFAAHERGTGLVYPDDPAEVMRLIEEWRSSDAVAKTYAKRSDDAQARLKALIGDAEGFEMEEGTLLWPRGTRKVIDRELMEKRAPVMARRWKEFQGRYSKVVPAQRGLRWKEIADGR